jgi:hypothetical protein
MEREVLKGAAMTARASFLLLLFCACGGSVAAPDEPIAEPRALPNPPPPRRAEPPRAPPPCAAPVVYERGASMLSTLDTTTATANAARSVTCAARIIAVAVERDGSVLALSEQGVLARIASGASTCAPIFTLPAPRLGYRGLVSTRIGDEDALFTIDTGTADDYYADGVYHHALHRIDLRTGARTKTATIDVVGYPDELHPAPNGRITWIADYGRELRIIDPSAGIVSTTTIDGAPIVRGVAFDAGRFFVIGDTHYARGGDLPTYAGSPGALSQMRDLRLPGGSIDGFVTGSASCAAF